jgi:multiple sugar transport system substrate-binding protein
MNRLMSLPVLATVAGLIALTSTSAPRPAAADPITIEYWQLDEAPDMCDYSVKGLQPYLEKHPNIKVNCRIIPWAELETMWSTAIKSGNTPDIGHAFDLMHPDYYRMGGLEPLDQYFDAQYLSRFNAHHVDNGRSPIDKRLYGIPLLASTDIVYYNKEMFQKAGIPLPDPNYSPSWEEYKGWLVKLKQAGFYGWDWGLREQLDHPYWDNWRRQGCEPFNENYTKIDFDSPECLAFAKEIQGVAQNIKALPPSALSTDWVRSAAFVKGEAAMVEYYGGLVSILKKYPAINWGVMRPYHGPGDGGKATASYGLESYLVVFKASKHKAEAIDMLKYMGSDDYLLYWNTRTGTFPPITGGEKIYDNADPKDKVASDLLWTLITDGTAKYFYNFPGMRRWSEESLLPQWQALMLGKTTPEAFCQTVTEDGNRILAEVNEK